MVRRFLSGGDAKRKLYDLVTANRDDIGTTRQGFTRCNILVGSNTPGLAHA